MKGENELKFTMIKNKKEENWLNKKKQNNNYQSLEHV